MTLLFETIWYAAKKLQHFRDLQLGLFYCLINFNYFNLKRITSGHKSYLNELLKKLIKLLSFQCIDVDNTAKPKENNKQKPLNFMGNNSRVLKKMKKKQNNCRFILLFWSYTLSTPNTQMKLCLMFI